MDALEYWQTVGQWELYLNTESASVHTPNLDNQSLAVVCETFCKPGGVGADTPKHK